MILGRVIVLILAAIMWVWLWYHTITKIGYRGEHRRWWLVGLCIPPINGFVLLALLVLPWPIQKQLKQLKQQGSPVPGVDDELEQLRRQME
jgi:hypothetical protein